MIKILLLSPAPPPVGGISTWTANLLAYLDKNPGNIEPVHQNTSHLKNDITRVDRIFKFYNGTIESIRTVRAFRKNLDYCNPDVVHLTTSASVALIKDFLIVRIASLHKIPVVLHLRFGRVPQLFMKKNWEWRLLCLVLGKCFRAIVLDMKSEDSLVIAGFRNILRIPNFIHIKPDSSRIIEREKIYEGSYRHIVYIGHITEKKGVYELVNACLQINKVDRLTLAGPYEPKEYSVLKNIAGKRDNGNWLHFTGTLKNSEVSELLRKAYLLALPSYTEGFPNIILEAEAEGCPVVASNVGAIPEQLAAASDHACGICVSPRDIPHLKAAIEYLSVNPGIACQMGKNGMAHVINNYTVDTVVRQYRDVWAEAALFRRGILSKSNHGTGNQLISERV